MPHVSVKCYPGRTEEQKQALAKAITENVKEIMKASEESISITIEDIQPEDWGSYHYRQHLCVLIIAVLYK